MGTVTTSSGHGTPGKMNDFISPTGPRCLIRPPTVISRKVMDARAAVRLILAVTTGMAGISPIRLQDTIRKNSVQKNGVKRRPSFSPNAEMQTSSRMKTITASMALLRPVGTRWCLR